MSTSASYVMVLPPGWIRLPAPQSELAELRRLVAGVIDTALPRTLPRDKAEPWRREITKRLLGAVHSAGEAGANAVYLPVEASAGFMAPVSIIESEIADELNIASSTLVAQLLALPESKAEACEVDGGLAVRLESFGTINPADSEWSGVANRQVVYLIQVPHLVGRWVVLSFSAATGNNSMASRELGDALVILFDALVSTFRWIDVSDVDPTQLEIQLQSCLLSFEGNTGVKSDS